MTQFSEIRYKQQFQYSIKYDRIQFQVNLEN